MSKFASKVATFLFASIILGASYLTCFLSAMPVSAATIPMQHNQNYTDESVGIPFTHSAISPSEKHGAVCKVTADNAVFELKSQRSNQDLNGFTALNTRSFYNETRIQLLHFNRFTTFPSKNIFLVGSVISRE